MSNHIIEIMKYHDKIDEPRPNYLNDIFKINISMKYFWQ